MIRQLEQVFILDTKRTSYCFQVLPSGHLEHLYYGKRLRIEQASETEALREKRAFPVGNTISYCAETPELCLEDVRLEMSSYGKGDIREPFVELLFEDGSVTSDFLYSGAQILQEKRSLDTLPSAYEEDGNVQELVLTLKESRYDLTLELHYSVFEDRDVIVRSAKLINYGAADVKLQRLMSLQVDYETSGYVMSTFNGSWAREMYRHNTVVEAGRFVNASYTGTSSNRANPFVMLSCPNTTEDAGDCYGFNLIYSGNHYSAAEVNAYGKTRFIMGINPQGFCFTVEPGEVFESPEAVMTYSDKGFNGMSYAMHDFVRECIVRGEWKHKQRPVLLNSWEAAYFDINEARLLKLAKAGKEVGIELFVMDDGWFGNRDDDTQSLGDWTVNKKKLPGGIKGICDKVNALGMDFGIWVEPEMVNTNSDLYRAHPEWVMEIPGRAHSEGRNQRLLDLANPKVVEYMTEQMTQVFSSANIAYVKWDMNRIFSDYYSTRLAPDRQGEVAHRYMMGLYRMMKTLTERFPHILFEGCASGGNRFDLGILCYFPQIWASDDTDAIYRAKGQTGYSYGYPLSTVTAHVSSCPNHQTLRVTPLSTRFHVAAFGLCGYECNLCDMKKEELEEIKEQIMLYKKWREVLQFGTFYRGRQAQATGEILSERNAAVYEWTCVSADKKKAVGLLLQELAEPNRPFGQYFPKGLDPEKKYRFYNIEKKCAVKAFGDLVNMIAPVHIRQDSLLHNVVNHFVKMPGETEEYIGYGQVLMSGIKLKSAFAGTGYNEQIRLFKDFESRLYFMECVEE